MRPGESFIGQPIRSLQTMLRVIANDDKTLPPVVPDGIYGSATLGAVSEFQRREGLPITGITDQNTWDQIVECYENALIRQDAAVPLSIIMDPGQVFSIGDEGPYIYLMQSLLIWLAKDHKQIMVIDHNGLFDEDTKQALTAFQKLAGLKETGELDKVTWKHLSNQFTLSAHHNSKRQLFHNKNNIY